MNRFASFASALATLLIAAPAFAQEVPPSGKPATPEIATCKTAALQAVSAKEPDIKDIYIDEDGATVAVSEAKVETIPVTRIIMETPEWFESWDQGRAYLADRMVGVSPETVDRRTTERLKRGDDGRWRWRGYLPGMRKLLERRPQPRIVLSASAR